MKTKKKIIFIFNQLLTSNIYTGGEIKSKKIMDLFIASKKYKVSCLIPQVTSKNFNQTKNIVLPPNIFEKIFIKPTLFSAFILFFSRTIQSFFKLKHLKNSILYTTGDFYCNTLPAFLTKLFYPQTIWNACIYHINPNPFQRKSNYFLASSISYVFQRFSFLLIKLKADHIFVLNKEVAKYLKKHHFYNQINISRAGLDIKSIQKDIKQNSKIKKRNQICFFSRLSPTKGIWDLAPLLSKLNKKNPRLKLHLVGPSDPLTLKNLKKDFKKYHCFKNVVFHGFLPNKTDVYKIIQQSKVAIFPSYEEGWNLALFETALCQTAIVSYQLPIYQEIFMDKLISVPQANINKLSQQINLLLSSKNTKKYALTIKEIAQKYDWQKVYKIESSIIKKQLSS